MLGSATQHRGRKLLVVANQNQLPAAFDNGNQRAGLGGWGRLVHEHDGELSRRQQAMTAPDGGGADHLGFIEDARRHGVLHAPNFLLVDVDVPVHEAFLFASEGGQGLAKFALLVLQKSKLLLHWMVFQHRVEGGRAKMLSNLDRSPNAEGFDAQRKQTFEQVVDGHVGLCRGEQRSAALLSKVVEQVGGRGGFPGPWRTLNQGQASGQGSLNRCLLRSVEMLVVGERPALDSLPTNVRGKFSALVDVKDVPEDEFPKHRPAIAFGGMEGDQGLVHAVVSDSVGASVKSPAAFSDVARSFADHHAKPRGPSVEHDPFHHLLAPRT